MFKVLSILQKNLVWAIPISMTLGLGFGYFFLMPVPSNSSLSRSPLLWIEAAKSAIHDRIIETSRRVTREIPQCPLNEENVQVRIGNPVKEILSTARKGNYDLIIMGTHGHGKLGQSIIGGGAAGLTAGIYASRARLNTVLIEKSAPGGQILLTDWIENYPGFPEGLAGHALVQQMTEQAKKFGLKMATDEVRSIDYSESHKKINLGDKTISTHSIIIATGASFRKLGISGEDRFYGKGVSSCATCDAPFYKDRVVVAVGGGDTAVQESLYLTKFAKKVYLVHRRDQLRATKILQERVLCNDKIEILWDHIPTRVDGFFNVEKVALKNVKTGEESTLPADGCFIWIGITPNTSFLNNGIKIDDTGFLMTDENMRTSVPGVFAAGDVRHTPLRQVATAVGDAAVAAISAERYIESITEKDHC